jgi:RNA polymerase sigma factor (sigma-70 family)
LYDLLISVKTTLQFFLKSHATILHEASSTYQMMFLKHRYSTEELITKCRTGHSKAQELLYKQFACKMLAVCMRYATDKMEAEDMLQNGFVRVFNKINDYRGEGSFEGWMRRIIVHSSIEYYRKHHKMVQVDIEESGYEQPVNAAAASSLETKHLLKLIQELPTGYRMVFNLYAIEGYSHKEIADMAGITEGASKSQLSRARAILKQRIEQLEGKHYEYAG